MVVPAAKLGLLATFGALPLLVLLEPQALRASAATARPATKV
jgi:hypothetical protein